MKEIPPITNRGSILVYGSAILGIGVIVSLAAPIGNGFFYILFAAAIVAVLGLVLAIIRLQKKYGYDERGFYENGKLLFDWSRIDKIQVSFNKSSGSVTLPVRPSFSAILSGPIIERESWVSYRPSLVFNLNDGSSIPITTNLNKMVSEGLLQHIFDVAKAANPSINFE